MFKVYNFRRTDTIYFELFYISLINTMALAVSGLTVEASILLNLKVDLVWPFLSWQTLGLEKPLKATFIIQ